MNNIDKVQYSEEAKRIIKEIDRATWVGGNMVSTPHGLCSLGNLSTGCLTVLNCLFADEDMVINVNECGYNVTEFLISASEASKCILYCSGLISFDMRRFESVD